MERLSLAISRRVASTLYNLKASLDSLPLSDVALDLVEEPSASEETMAALIQDQMYALTHSWRQPSMVGKVSLTRYLLNCMM